MLKQHKGSTTISGLPSNENYSGGSGSSGSEESAGDTDTGPARLVYQENYNLDINAKGYDEIDIPLNNNQTEQDVLNGLKQKAQAYNGNLQYDPLAREDEYNSNSFIAGLLNAIGCDGSNLVSSLLGVQSDSDKPVPIYLFELGFYEINIVLLYNYVMYQLQFHFFSCWTMGFVCSTK